MLLDELVRTHAAVAATRSRLRKRELLAAALRDAAPPPATAPEGDDADEIEIVAAYLSGRPRQRRTGIGWRTLADLPPATDVATLTPAEVDAALSAMQALEGAGSHTTRSQAFTELFSRATADEQRFLSGLLRGELRQGALDSLLLDAIAAAADVPVKAVRRAAMFSAVSGPIARAALTGGASALESFRLQVGRPVRPMLASSAPDVGAAAERFAGAAVAADVKLDGIRVQVHVTGDDVAVFTRSLDDITDRLPEVVTLAQSLDVEAAVLDGEALALDEAGRPRPFQETASRTGTHEADPASSLPLTVRFFDLLHLDGTDLVDAPARERLAALDRAVPADAVVPRVVDADAGALQEFFDEVVGAGHEGLVVKDLDAPYAAGKRGAAWVKVKPRHTLDLVVLAVEQGSGRRQGWLSNIHLGARDPESGGFVMLGKTFKGMTDEMLAWQTERFTELAEGPTDGYVVQVRPEQVVEIAFDGVQRSTRYPGGVALRFARVVRYRDDKTAAEADTIDAVRGLLTGSGTSND
ncbi:ATP-dependent DNA ligase [Isoptericola sp. b515]|uniref:ATP-dependent DNA ligase n=1 Tax=Isoptericola sp. b515 TaxID=3064652 RepID=UPI0027129BE7|nr:ATP-dependent DNA ligase [Isoptericola sp. b515]MDO8149472.1 ATP-dependent DNA ligase [Isoptericola sp. b515]